MTSQLSVWAIGINYKANVFFVFVFVFLFCFVFLLPLLYILDVFEFE